MIANPSLERMTVGYRSKRQLLKLFTMADLYALSNQLIKLSYFLIPTQSYSFFGNLPPLGFSLYVYEQDLVAQD